MSQISFSLIDCCWTVAEIPEHCNITGKFNIEVQAFLSLAVATDETWVRGFDPELKLQPN